VVVEDAIDDGRRKNAFGLLPLLNMLVETGDGFNFTTADLQHWCHNLGFRRFDHMPLQGPPQA